MLFEVDYTAPKHTTILDIGATPAGEHRRKFRRFVEACSERGLSNRLRIEHGDVRAIRIYGRNVQRYAEPQRDDQGALYTFHVTIQGENGPIVGIYNPRYDLLGVPSLPDRCC